jgi:2-succinyl-6-hydroxy-2,4-cyclohexadiene-1-carboxylate synthase
MRLVYFHGMGGSPRDWDSVSALLPGTALCLPHGLSFDAAAEKMAGELRSLHEPFVLCGYSMGGRLAIRTAKKLIGNSQLRGLFLVSTGLGLEAEKERAARHAIDERWAQKTEDSALFWKEWYAQELFSSFRALPESTRHKWMHDRFSLNIEHLQSQIRLLGPGNHEYLLPELKALQKAGISVLYIVGERDKKYASTARQLNLPVEILDGGHVLPIENPVAVAQSLEQFLLRETKGNRDGKEYR